MSITSVVNDLVTSVSVINALKPLPPTISGYSVGGLDDTALDPAGGQTVQINGTGFLAGATITFDGNAVAVVTYVNPNQLTFTSPAKSAGTYTIYVVNSDGGTAIFIPGIIYSVLPTWTTSAGSLGSYYETTSISNTVVASGDAPITYSLFSGSLPTGSTLYANGVITGTAPVDSSSTTYSFTIQATDAQLQDSTRSFSLTINVDAVTWVSPANNTTYTSAVDSAISNVALSATDAAGYAVSYSANALPTGLSLTGANISGTPTVIADSSTLLTATAATTNRSAVRTINWSITVANDPYFEYNTLLIPGASTTFVDDASTNNFNVSIFGDTRPNSFNPYTPGYYSNYFDGTGDYISVPDNVAFTMGAGDFTIECWVYLQSVSQQIFIGTCDAGGNQGSMSFVLGLNGSSYPIVGVGYGGTVYFSTFGTVATTNRWYHIAGVRNGAMVNVYVDGVKGPNLDMGALAITDSTEIVAVGRNGAGNFEYVTGYISNVRVVKGTAVYTAAFTPPTSPLTAIANTSLLTCQSNRFIDNSTNAFTVTVGGNTTVNSFDPFTPNSSYSTYGSGYFDGSGDYLSVPGNSVFAFGTGDFTLEVWLYANSISTGTFDRICATSDYNGSGFDWTLNTNSSGLFLASTSYSIGSITPKVWHHLVYTRSGSTIRGFLNGNLSSYATSGSQNISSTSTLAIGTGYSGTPLNGYLVDLRIIKGSIPAGYQTSSTTTGTQIFTPPSEPLTAIANTSLLILQNNQSVNNNVFLDNSTNNFLVTRAGNTTQGTFSPYGGNWSNYFDGNGDSLTASAITGFSTTGDLTLECWAYVTSASDYGGLAGMRNSTSAAGLSINILNTGYLEWAINTNYSGTLCPLNQWFHVALVRSGSSANNCSCYLNGTRVGQFSSTTEANATDAFIIGRYYANGANQYFLNGYISNVRYVKGTALYSGTTYTVPTTPLTAITNTVLLTCQSNRLIDNSVNNFTITKNGDVSVQRFSPFNPSIVTPTSYSGYFDGTGDYLTPTASSEYAFATGDFTVECWVYLPSSPGGEVGFVSTFNTGGGQGFILGTGAGGNAGKLHIGLGNGTGSGNFDLYDSVNLSVNTWVHVAAVRSSGTVTLYKNGVSVGSGSGTNNIERTLLGISISYPNSPQGYVTGYISNVRIVKGTAVYTSTFTPSTTPLTAVSGTSLLTCQSPTFIDNSTNAFAITASGNSQPTQQNPFGFTSATTNGYTVSTIGGSGYFDGTGDYLTAPSNSALAFPADFTIECWVYPLAWATNAPISSGSTGAVQLSKYGANANLGVAIQGLAWHITDAALPTLNTWSHVALTRSGSTLKIFINGVQSGSTGSTAYSFTTTNLIGGDGTSYFQGYISDFRVVKSTALYTSNFVPPAQPLTAIQNTSLLTNMTSAGVYDAAMMTNMETVADAQLSTTVTKFGGSSVSFDGTGDYLFSPTLNVNNLSKFLTSNFTVECWIYPTTTSGDRTIICAVYSWGAGANYEIELRSGVLFVQIGNGITLTSGTTSISANTWTHIALVRSSTTSTTFYVNGVSVATTATNWTADEDCPLTIGCFNINGGSLSNYWQGYIDDLRITKGYARYTSNFTAPTSAFPIY